MEGLKNLDELKGFFHPGWLMFTNDSDENGIDNRLISTGLRLDMNMSRRESGMWYLTDTKGSLVRYHPVGENTPYFQKVAKEKRLITRIDFLAGQAPIIYNVAKAILDNTQFIDEPYFVGIPNLGNYMANVTVFRNMKTGKGQSYVPDREPIKIGKDSIVVPQTTEETEFEKNLKKQGFTHFLF